MIRILVLLSFLICPLLAKNDVLDKIHAGEKFIVRLRSVNSQEYLYPGERDFSEDARRRRVFTYKLDVDKQTGSNDADWQVEPLVEVPQEGGNVNLYEAEHAGAVRLSSVRYPNEYLLAGTDGLTLDETRRKIYTWKETGTDFSGWGGPDVWYFLESPTPKDNRASLNHFEIRNRKFNEDLFASGDRFEMDKRFGNVYTCRQGSEEKGKELCSDARNIWEVVVVPHVQQQKQETRQPGLMDQVKNVFS